MGLSGKAMFCPSGMNIVAASLKRWHQALRDGEFDAVGGY